MCVWLSICWCIRRMQNTSLKVYPIDQRWEWQSPSPLSIIDVAIRAEPERHCLGLPPKSGWELTSHCFSWLQIRWDWPTTVILKLQSLMQEFTSKSLTHPPQNQTFITSQHNFLFSNPHRFQKTLWSSKGKYHLDQFNSEEAGHVEQHKATFSSLSCV